MVVEVVAADDHQPGETLVMVQTQTAVQVLAMIRKQIEKGIALPFVFLLCQQDMTGVSSTCWDGTQIPLVYALSVNEFLKCATTCSEAESTKPSRMQLVMY
jgi:hypothetical protein